MFKVSLINPPERILNGSLKYYLPFALLYLAAFLEENNVNVDIIDIKTGRNYLDAFKNKISDYYHSIKQKHSVIKNGLYPSVIDKIIEATVSSSPRLIGISCMTMEYSSVMRIASLLKERLAVPIVVGGIHPSLYPEQFIFDKSPVDFVVIGEGEETLLELARYIESGKVNYENIDGIAYLKEGRCHRAQIRSIKNDFLVSPIQVYKKLDMAFYTEPHAYITRHVRISGVQIFTSRGCPYKCTFCSNAVIMQMNKRYKSVRYRPVKSVIEEIKFLRDTYHIDGFYIMDDTFCMDKRYVEEFCSELANAGIHLVWAAETRANLIDELLLKKMKKAGLVQIDIGVESGSDQMLREIQKGITVQDILQLFSLAHKYNIRTFASLIVNLPNETLEQLQETIHLLEKIRPSSGVIGTTIPLPKTELFNKYFAHKVKSDQEVIELLGPRLSYYKATDKRFHFCKYSIDFEALINRLIIKHFLFAELQLGKWYWKVFFKSKRKTAYLFSIIQGISNVFERIIFRYS